MRVLCICPTWGRTPDILNNALALFQLQTYEDKYLIVYDDLGNVSESEGENWRIVSTNKREPSLARKYMATVEQYSNWDALAVRDDDDVYFPNHLADSLHVFKTRAKPSKISTTHRQKGGNVAIENAIGKFHASVVLTKSTFNESGGWTTDRPDFDLQWLSRLRKIGDPQDSCIDGRVTYVYRWEDTNNHHVSAASENWWVGSKPKFTDTIKVHPQLDQTTRKLLQKHESLYRDRQTNIQ